jgi:hypothetical protein
MPEAGQAGAERLLRRLQFALGGRVDNGDDGVRLHAGLVEFRSEEDDSRVTRRAVEALERSKLASEQSLSSSGASPEASAR